MSQCTFSSILAKVYSALIISGEVFSDKKAGNTRGFNYAKHFLTVVGQLGRNLSKYAAVQFQTETDLTGGVCFCQLSVCLTGLLEPNLIASKYSSKKHA